MNSSSVDSGRRGSTLSEILGSSVSSSGITPCNSPTFETASLSPINSPSQLKVDAMGGKTIPPDIQTPTMNSTSRMNLNESAIITPEASHTNSSFFPNSASRSSTKIKSDSNGYLGNRGMHATSSSVALASTVLGLDIVELWTEEKNSELESNGLFCTYVYATDDLRQIYPDIITGFPNLKEPKKHLVSPNLCKLARESREHYHWRIAELSEGPTARSGTRGCSALHEELRAPMRTEIAYHCEGEFGNLNVYIVGYSLAKIVVKPNKLKFLNGLGCAIYVAAFEFDDDDDDDDSHSGDLSGNSSELKNLGNAEALEVSGNYDNTLSQINSIIVKNSVVNSRTVGSLPRFYTSTSNFASLLNENNVSGSFKQQGGLTTMTELSASSPYINKTEDESYCIGSLPSESIAMTMSNLSRTNSINSSGIDVINELKRAYSFELNDISCNDVAISDSNVNTLSAQHHQDQVEAVQTILGAPAWVPMHPFSFDINKISIADMGHQIYENVNIYSLTEFNHLTSSNTCDIFTATFQNKDTVIVKMIKDTMKFDHTAVADFETEYGILSRLNHSNVIRLIGAGRIPRHFLILEYLKGGSLFNTLAETRAKRNNNSLIGRMLTTKNATFTYMMLLNKALDLAEVLQYLHFNVHEGATIIHRDIKPDNIGFNEKGKLKLFDFGLCTCVKRRSHDTEAYKMSGGTGSIKYMAPEVLLDLPYTEKVDIYSFAIVVWEMASDKPVFEKINTKQELIEKVAKKGKRPNLESNWPPGFRELLTSCWNEDPILRPPAQEVSEKLRCLIKECQSEAQKKNSGLLTSFLY